MPQALFQLTALVRLPGLPCSLDFGFRTYMSNTSPALTSGHTSEVTIRLAVVICFWTFYGRSAPRRLEVGAHSSLLACISVCTGETITHLKGLKLKSKHCSLPHTHADRASHKSSPPSCGRYLHCQVGTGFPAGGIQAARVLGPLLGLSFCSSQTFPGSVHWSPRSGFPLLVQSCGKLTHWTWQHIAPPRPR